MMENPIKIDDLGMPPFKEPSMMSGSFWSLQPTKLAPDCHPEEGVDGERGDAVEQQIGN